MKKKKGLRNQAFRSVLDTMLEIHTIKDHDYGGDEYLGNFKQSSKIGIEDWKGVLIRMGDKMSRIQNLATKEGLVDESINDSLLDLANYAVIALILRGFNEE